MRNVKLFTPNIHTNEWIAELKNTFESGWLAQSSKVAEFENAFGKQFGYNFCVGVNSGTAALELAFHLAGIKKGDKVLTPVLTCTATNLPLVHIGAKIQFVDIGKETLTMCVNDFKKKLKGAKAVVLVNLGGLRCDNRIYEMCRDAGVPVIVDACQSLGIPEPQGDFVCYSFQAIKHFTTGDGGMLVVRKPSDHLRAKRLRWFGIDREVRQKLNFNFTPTNREMCMNMDEPGWKLHMNDIQATMGLVGLKYSDQDLLQRRSLSNAYLKRLADRLPIVVGGSDWLFCIMLENRDGGIMDRIKERGVECDLVHLRNDIFTPFGSKRQKLPNMAWVEERYMYIPMHINLTFDEIDYVCEVILDELP